MHLRKSALIIAILSLTFSSAAAAHPGRTDSSGGHTCRTNCEKWGYEYGEYHYHNGGGSSSTGSSSSGSSSSSSSEAATPAPAPSTPKEVIPPGTVRVTLPAFSVVVNGQQVANASTAYPVIVYNDITYFPMTWNYTQALGLDTAWDANTGFSIRKSDRAGAALSLDYGTPASKLYAKKPGFNIYVNDVWLDNAKEAYPVLVLNDVTYFPMTWKFAVEELGLQISFANNTFTISK
ncbi:YHYH domain-containing protein [Paenibacillus sp. KR2-11]|uniref:YHYH domain-containing protein n=1 Tax=Paenibacillus sp. KR2-11 TaxID=3385500 RepID=UPI0038FD20D6